MRLFGRRTLRAYDVISVLSFSILANFIFGLYIDFTTSFDVIAVARLICLSAGCVAFYSISAQLSEYWAYASAEFASEKTLEKRAGRSAEDRFNGYVAQVRGRLSVRLLVAVVLVAAFFLLDPLVRLLEGSAS